MIFLPISMLRLLTLGEFYYYSYFYFVFKVLNSNLKHFCWVLYKLVEPPFQMLEIYFVGYHTYCCNQINLITSKVENYPMRVFYYLCYFLVYNFTQIKLVLNMSIVTFIRPDIISQLYSSRYVDSCSDHMGHRAALKDYK